jgi:hypothetical protein
MKNSLLIAFILIANIIRAQQVKDTTIIYKYKARWYNISPCGCYTFPERDTIYIKKDSIHFTFNREKELKKYSKT